MGGDVRTAAWLVGLPLLLILGGSPLASADRIRFRDGTEVSATLVQKDGDSVIVRLPRSAISTVNGEPLPLPVVPGAAAPDFKVVDLSGATHSMAENRGHVTLLQFWATWCPHCRSDLKLMKTLLPRYQDKGLRILTVSVDRDVETLQGFLRHDPLPYPVISAASQPDLLERYEMEGIPAYYLIDAQGTIVKIWRGSVTESSSDFESTLTSQLASADRSTPPSTAPAATPASH